MNDHGTHHNWEPNEDMKLADFQSLLAATHPSWKRITDAKGNAV